MGATPGNFGTVQAQAHLRHVLSILNVIVVPWPFVAIPNAYEAFDADGNLTNTMAAGNLENLLARLIQTTKAIGAAQG